MGHVLREFIPASTLNTLTQTSSDGDITLQNWPPFIPDPLLIALTYFHLEATKPSGSWALTTMNMKLKYTSGIPLFQGKIQISNLELDLNYEKDRQPSTYGVVLGQIALINSDEQKNSPKVDVRIPFPFNDDEISFTFTDFNVKNVVEALAGPNIFPTDFKELFENIELDKIALTFDEAGKIETISVDASIPGLWNIFGQFSVGNVGIHFEYGTHTTSSSSGGGSGLHSDSPDTKLLHTRQQASKTWRLMVRGQIVISTCTISVEIDLGSNLVSVTAEGTRCSVSISDILEAIHLNGKMLPPMISGFTIFNPKLRLLWQRTGRKSKSIAFAATTSLFHQSEVRTMYWFRFFHRIIEIPNLIFLPDTSFTSYC